MNVLKTSVLIFVMLFGCLITAPSFAEDNVSLQDVIHKAEQGDADAQNSLGLKYAKGEGISKDYKEATKWFKKAAEQGNAKGQYNLGFSYDNGEGVPQDKKEAVKWFRKAAEQGLAYAQYLLGLVYADGEGVPQDIKEAANWLRKAAEQGNTDALDIRYDG